MMPVEIMQVRTRVRREGHVIESKSIYRVDMREISGVTGKVAQCIIIGGLFGWLVLHPASMFIHHYFEQHHVALWETYRQSFSPSHFHMAIYFVVLGMLFGGIYGLLSLRIARLYERVKELSITDDLTSLYNRRYLMNELEKAMAHARRYAQRLSLLMIDIDHFKQYNDAYGHRCGDDLLRTLGGHMKRFVRKSDFVARYGGEEFIIVVPEADKEMACKMAERLRTYVENLPFPSKVAQPVGKVTVSVGIAELTEETATITDFIGKADSALYRAKQEGRNRVCIW